MSVDDYTFALSLLVRTGESVEIFPEVFFVRVLEEGVERLSVGAVGGRDLLLDELVLLVEVALGGEEDIES